MSLTSSFGYTNVTDNTVKVTPKSLAVVTNYANIEESSTQVVLDNKTSPLDQQELVTFNCRPLPIVNTKANVRYPAKVQSGVQYTVQIEEVLKTTSTDDAAFRVDEPIVMSLMIRHPKSGNITPAIVTEVLCRLLGACQKADGSFRWSDLMRSALDPKDN